MNALADWQRQTGADLAQAFIRDFARKSELAISWGRAVMVTLMLARFLTLEPRLEAVLLIVPVAVLGLAMSFAFITNFFQVQQRGTWLWYSVILDCALGFVILANNSFLATPLPVGVVHAPDSAALLLLTIAAGFRLSVPIALFGGGLNFLFFLGFATFEAYVGAAALPSVAMWLIAHLGAVMIACIAAWFARSIAKVTAAHATQAKSMRDGMTILLDTHHDAHGVLSSVILNAELLMRKTAMNNPETAPIAEDLRADLDVVKTSMLGLVWDAQGQLEVADQEEKLDLGVRVPALLGRLRATCPALEIHWSGSPSAPVILSGGEVALHRLITNLIRNAAGGNGNRHASLVRVSLKTDGLTHAVLLFEDNGPGFASDTSLPNGAGVGLASVRRIVEKSGGKAWLGQSSLGGALVGLSFPLCESAAEDQSFKPQQQTRPRLARSLAALLGLPSLVKWR